MTAAEAFHNHRGLFSPITVIREQDGCYYVKCDGCESRGPKKHSRKMGVFRFRIRGFVT